MQTIQKKHPSARRPGLTALLILALAALAGLLLLLHASRQTASEPAPAFVSTAQTLYEYAPEEVQRITISRSGEQPWTVERDASGCMVLLEAQPIPLSDTSGAMLTSAASIIACSSVLSDNPAEYTPHMAVYGLQPPDCTARITYADGQTVTLLLGFISHENSWYYMQLEGDDRLFAMARGLAEDLFVSRDSLLEITQPVIHRARMDRITFSRGEETLGQWTLAADIADSDALDRWQITAPFVYPADAAAMNSLLGNLANFRLGALVGPATPELLTECGFDPPRLTMTLHMAPGAIAMVGTAGAAEARDFPESECVITIGGARSDLVDYVLYDGHIYVSSHFTLGVFLDMKPERTMSKYLVQTALGNLASLTISTPEGSVVYTLTRNEVVGPNNELQLDDNGRPLLETTCTRNGEPFDYSAFEAAYSQLILTTVSGELPDPNATFPPPHTTYAFVDVNGMVSTVALADFDVLHDAVLLGGHPVYYLIKGGFRLNLN